MAEFEDKLNQLLSNPEAMAQIASLAQSLGAGSGSSQRPAPANAASQPREPAASSFPQPGTDAVPPKDRNEHKPPNDPSQLAQAAGRDPRSYDRTHSFGSGEQEPGVHGKTPGSVSGQQAHRNPPPQSAASTPDQFSRLLQAFCAASGGSGCEPPDGRQDAIPSDKPRPGGGFGGGPDLNMEELLRMAGPLLQALSQGDKKEQGLLCALKPYVTPEKQKKIDRAMEISRIAKLATFALGDLGKRGE